MIALVEWIQGAGAVGLLAFTAAYLLSALSLFPGSVLSLAAGFSYGTARGAVLVSVASTLGAALAFLLGRSLLRRRIEARVTADRRLSAIDAAIADRGFSIVLLLRLSPVLPYSPLNYALALTGVRWSDYLAASWIGMLPGTVLLVYLGSLVSRARDLAAGRPSGGLAEQALYFGGLLATVLVSVILTRVARRALAAELAV